MCLYYNKEVVVKKRMENCGFPKKIRVKKGSEFDQIIKNGSKRLGENLALYRLRSSDEGQKFGIKIARGIKGAVKRNKIKRILRETLRKNKDKFDPNEKVVVLFRSPGKGKNRPDGRPQTGARPSPSGRMVHTGGIDFEKLKKELESLIK
jgi:ribonuclease P protein component